MKQLRKIVNNASSVYRGLIKLYWPMRWLIHYLLGSGKSLRVPKFIIKEAVKSILTAIYYNWDYIDVYNNGWYSTWGYNQVNNFRFKMNGKRYFKCCLNNSQIYEGSGFWGRPTLFYLVGGFTFWAEIWGPRIKILGVDHYDWHPNENGWFFESPIGHNIVAKIILALARWFGWGRFIHIGDNGDVVISNEFWYHMKQYGAKEFRTIISGTLIATPKQRRKLP